MAGPTRSLESFAAELVARFGRPMERALIRAGQRYDAQKPTRLRMRKLHTDYRRRSRRA